jgi:transposase
MWTKENRRRYDCSDLRYKSDLTDDERAEIVSLIPPAKPGRKKRSVNPREVVNGLMYILSTGCQCARSQRIWRRTRRSRRRGVAAGHSVRPMSVLAQALRGRRLSGARVPQVHQSRALSGSSSVPIRSRASSCCPNAAGWREPSPCSTIVPTWTRIGRTSIARRKLFC